MEADVIFNDICNIYLFVFNRTLRYSCICIFFGFLWAVCKYLSLVGALREIRCEVINRFNLMIWDNRSTNLNENRWLDVLLFSSYFLEFFSNLLKCILELKILTVNMCIKLLIWFSISSNQEGKKRKKKRVRMYVRARMWNSGTFFFTCKSFTGKHS
jgi:hypothetical protein